MPKRAKFGNIEMVFPDDATDDEIAEVLDAESKRGPSPTDVSNLSAPLPALQPSQGFLEGLQRFGSEAIAPITGTIQLGKDIWNRGATAVASDVIDSSRQNVQNFLANPSLESGVKAIPLIGPAMDRSAEMFAHGDIGGGIGSALATALPFAPKTIRGMLPKKIGPILSNKLNPTEEAALKSVEGRVPMSAGQRTGTKAIERVERSLENFPGSYGRTQEFYGKQGDALATEASRLAAKASPTSLDPVGAGQGVQNRLATRISRLKGQADQSYDTIRQKLSANKQTKQVGVDTKGQPILQDFESPVDMAEVRAQLKPVYDSLNAAMPVARRDNSPAFRALQEIVTNTDPYMAAADVDRSLSAIKSLIREGQQNPFLSTPAQRTASQAVNRLEAGFQKTLAATDPKLPAQLTQARKTVRAYHDTAELLSDLPTEPSQLYSRLVSRDDRILNNLTELSKIAPNEVRATGRTFLEQMVDKATNEGGFGRAQGTLGEWNRMGPRTKELLYGPGLSKELDNFFLAAKKLTSDVNPSGTAKVYAALGGLGTVGAIITQLVQGNPGAAAATVGGTAVAPNLAARLLFTPSGARLMTRAITLPTDSAAFRHTIQLLNARYLSEAKRDRQQKEAEQLATPLEPVPDRPAN